MQTESNVEQTDEEDTDEMTSYLTMKRRTQMSSPATRQHPSFSPLHAGGSAGTGMATVSTARHAIIAVVTYVSAGVVLAAGMSTAMTSPAVRGAGVVETRASQQAVSVAYPSCMVRNAGTLSPRRPSAQVVSSGRRTVWHRPRQICCRPSRACSRPKRRQMTSLATRQHPSFSPLHAGGSARTGMATVSTARHGIIAVVTFVSAGVDLVAGMSTAMT